eukprot:g1911.t1
MEDREGGPTSTTQLYCGNLPYAMNTSMLKRRFEKFGKLCDAFIAHKDGTSRGFGFVTFVNPLNAERACAAMDGEVINMYDEKRKMKVMFARPRPEEKKRAYARESTREPGAQKASLRSKAFRGAPPGRSKAKHPRGRRSKEVKSAPTPPPEKREEPPKTEKAKTPKANDTKVRQHAGEIALRKHFEKLWHGDVLNLEKLSASSKEKLLSHLKSIVDYIVKSRAIRKILLSKNALSDDFIVAICSAITSGVVTHLDLSHNDITAEGARSLARALQSSTCQLIDLNVAFNRITKSGVFHIAGALSFNENLEVLDLECNHLDSDAGAALGAILTNNKSLVTLNLSRSVLDEERGYGPIARGIERNSTLKTLVLKRSALGNKGSACIANAMCKNQSIRRLDLHFNKIGDDLKAFEEMLKENTTLRELILSYNLVGPKGAHSIAAALTSKSFLSHLDVRYNAIMDDGADAIANAAKRKRDLNVKFGVNFISSARMESLITIEGVTVCVEK